MRHQINWLAAFVGLLGIVASQNVAVTAPIDDGQWSSSIPWPNVAIHMHLLPNGKVLFWGRREWNNDGTTNQSLDEHNCTPRLWDPVNGTFSELPRPGYNLFCSGHAFMADGRLLVVGGHERDSFGVANASVFDFRNNTWTAIDSMNRGRWYPTAVTLSNGKVLVSAGKDELSQMNVQQQICDGVHFAPMGAHNDIPLYPKMHVVADGRVFLSGHLQLTQLFDSTTGNWQRVGDSVGRQREDGCSVMYDVGKVMIVGGGLSPQKSAEIIDLNQAAPSWIQTDEMAYERRHHNATLLPDGTVLVTGGTSGGGVFNDLTNPVYAAELWDPATGQWTELAAESVPRLYHSSAILLPDATVVSAGGGEFRKDSDNLPNDPQDSHRNAQLFSPPYLFKSTATEPRPDILTAPDTISYGQQFSVTTTRPEQIAQISLVRLSSTTHSWNMNQRINFLQFSNIGGNITISVPSGPNLCPPGHYMLFVLNQSKVPSVAKIVRIQ